MCSLIPDLTVFQYFSSQVLLSLANILVSWRLSLAHVVMTLHDVSTNV